MKSHSYLFLVAMALVGQSFAHAASGYKTIIQKKPELPLTVFNVTFRLGSASDPRGEEGIADLTAHLMREGGVEGVKLFKRPKPLPALTRSALEEIMYPMAFEIGVIVGKEQTSFQVTCAAADADRVLDLLAQMILAPAFDSTEFDRLKAETIDALTKQLPRDDEEELGKSYLDWAIYGPEHPYSHVALGKVEAVRGLTLGKVRKFYKTHFTPSRLIVAATGVVTSALEARLKKTFDALSGLDDIYSGESIPKAPAQSNLRLTLVRGSFDAVGVHMGEALSVTRASADFPALYLASWAFGKHRSFVGRLMRVVREVRGLNYGTYSYVEDFPDGGAHMIEPTQAARSRQAFTVWGRPTPTANGCFLFKQIFREVQSLAQTGLTKDEFKLTQSHLIGNAPLLATGLERRLGYAVDSEFYGIKGDYLVNLERSAHALTLEKVNATLKKYLHPEKMSLVVVTPDPEKFKADFASASCGITYGAGVVKPAEVRHEDGLIGGSHPPLTQEEITIVDAESLF